MTANEAYERYLIELQGNGTTDNIQSSKGRFVVNFNKYQNRVVEWLIERNNEDDNRYLQKIKVFDEPLKKNSDKSSSLLDSFDIPTNYFDFLDIRSFGTKENCKDQPFFVKEVKGGNLNNLLTDEHSKPSFKFRESFYIVGNDSINLYKEDFDFTKTLLTYYRYPKQLELEHPNNPDSQLKNEELEFDDKLSNRVITLAVSGQSLNSNEQKYQFFKQEVNSKL